jgi:hypothetical protein
LQIDFDFIILNCEDFTIQNNATQGKTETMSGVARTFSVSALQECLAVFRRLENNPAGKSF